MKADGHRFRVLPGAYAVCRLAPGAASPRWAVGDFVSVTTTAEEVSVICAATHVPAEVIAERDWRVLQVIGPLPFTAVGVLAALAAPLAKADLSLLAVATYDTDYLLVKAAALDAARSVLAAAGHTAVD